MVRLFYLVLALTLSAASAKAKAPDIDDLEKNIKELEENVNYSSCGQKCKGYSITTVICSKGYMLVDCPTKGCSYFHQCKEGDKHVPSTINLYIPENQ